MPSLFMLLRSKPNFKYSGLTIVLSNPSRFDLRTKQLLSANGGAYFINECLQPETTKFACDIRLATETEDLLPDTRVVLLLGEESVKKNLPELASNTLGEVRGSPYYSKERGIIYISSYLPQDAVDMKDYEKTNNPILKAKAQEIDLALKSVDDLGEKKRKGITNRSNYGFWLKQDTKKALRLLKNPQLLQTYANPDYIIYPSSTNIIQLLSTTKGQFLDFDMETFGDDHTMSCFGFSFGDSNQVYVVPLYRHDYTLAYDALQTAKILRALCVAVRDNTLVAHNGAGYDYPVLALRYHIPVRKVYDTMVAHHRCYPCIEKSLGHCISLELYEPYHKDESNFAFGNTEQAMQLWKYNGKDVWTMKLLRKAQQVNARRLPGLQDSIDQANNSIVPYLISNLQGIRYRSDKIIEIMAENDRLMTQYLRILTLLKGSDIVPTSNKQCVKYFHDELQYPIIKRSLKTNQPSLDEKSMLKLRLKFENPSIDFCLAYRQVAKESGSLKFIPWKE